MSALRWATVPVLAGVLTGNIASAAANQQPDPPPTSAPAAAQDPTAPTTDPAAPPEPDPSAPAPDSVTYVTTITTTTTTINAPIIVVAAPITTNLNTSNSTSTSGPNATNGKLARERVVMNLKGCGEPGRQTPARPTDRVRYAHVRLARDATLVVRVNGKQVATLRLPTDAQHRALRLRLAPNGMLSIQRPSGRVLAVQGCTPA